MGIEKIAGEYIQEMTEPSGWPDIDENILFARANELLELRNAVSAAVDQWNREYSSIFESGSWRGSGAEAGGSSIQTSLRAMSQLQNHLAKGYAYYNMVAGLVAQAKTTINQNLQSAQEMIQTIRETPGLDEQSKEEIIRGYVLSQRGLNASVVVSGASQVSIAREGRTLTIGDRELKEGDVITIDGANGQVMAGEVATIEPELAGDFGTLMEWADAARDIAVIAEAATIVANLGINQPRNQRPHHR